MCGIFKHKSIINICLKVKQVRVTLWICDTDQQIKTKERLKGESSRLCKLQMENRILQIATAHCVINGVYCLNITQNVSCFRWILWCHFEKIYCRNSIYLFFFFLFWQLKIHNKLLSCWKPSHWQYVHRSLFNPQFLCMVLSETF